MHASVSIPNASMNMQKIFKINIFENVENTEAGVGVSVLVPGASQKCWTCMVRNVETIKREIDFYSR